MVRVRIACAAALAVALLSSPSAALAQSAGDNQYVDPLAGQQSQPTHHATQHGSSAPSQAATPSSSAPSASAPATSSAAPSSSAQPSAAAAPQSTSVPLARTGFDAWIPAAAGAVLIAAAVALRRSARQHRA